jgi:hypothetical protein
MRPTKRLSLATGERGGRVEEKKERAERAGEVLPYRY